MIGLVAGLAAKQPLDSDLTAIAALSPASDTVIQRKVGMWVASTPTEYKTDLNLSKSDVGLGNVTNTSDSAKPVSTATQTALDAKQPLDSDLTTIAALTATTDNIIQSVGSAWASRTPAQVKTTLALTKSDVGLGNVDNTTDANKPVSTATQTALDAKANIARTINTYSGTSLTAVAADAGAYVRCTGTNPTYTLPPNASVAFAVGTQIDGVGTATAMTLVAGGGVTVNKARTLVTVAADSGWTAIKVATNEWDVHGDFV